MTRQEFIEQLLAIRDDAQLQLTNRLVENIGDKLPIELATDDARAVLHASEFALALLIEEYVPKREAIDDAWRVLDRYGS